MAGCSRQVACRSRLWRRPFGNQHRQDRTVDKHAGSSIAPGLLLLHRAGLPVEGQGRPGQICKRTGRAGIRQPGGVDPPAYALHMKIGLQVADFTWPGAPASIGPTFARIARDADEAGIASLWVMDHFFQISMIGPPEHEMLEGYSALAYAAGVTKTITLGTMVTGVTYRHPGLLIKTVTTLDVLSSGRAWLGIGAAWNEQQGVGKVGSHGG